MWIKNIIVLVFCFSSSVSLAGGGEVKCKPFESSEELPFIRKIKPENCTIRFNENELLIQEMVANTIAQRKAEYPFKLKCTQDGYTLDSKVYTDSSHNLIKELSEKINTYFKHRPNDNPMFTAFQKKQFLSNIDISKIVSILETFHSSGCTYHLSTTDRVRKNTQIIKEKTLPESQDADSKLNEEAQTSR